MRPGRAGGPARPAAPDDGPEEDLSLNRFGFMLKIRPDMAAEYRRHHAAVWPEMLDALRRAGWHNYSLFLREDGTLFGYVETQGSPADARAAMASESVNERWQAMMGPFFEGSGLPADEMMEELEEVFHLP
jgi:L-rhamnose mutarotase